MKDMDVMIFGRSHSGKTTLARMLAKTLHYPTFHTDVFFEAFTRSFPEHEELLYLEGSEHHKTSMELLDFIHRFIRRNKYYDGKLETRYIIEGAAVSVPNCMRFFHPELNLVVYLGVTETTPEAFLQTVRENPREYDSILTMPEDEALELLSLFITQGREARRLCGEYGIRFLDTTFDREAKLAALHDEMIETLRLADAEEA